MNEISCLFVSKMDPNMPHSNGKIHSGMECGEIDEHDCKVFIGQNDRFTLEKLGV